MNRVESFEDLRIWKEARELVKHIYSDLKANRDYGFCDQIQRAGVSIMNNITEGFERHSDTEFARFLNIAKGSAGEVRSMYYAAEDLSYVSGHVATERRKFLKSISKGIGSLEGYLRK
ncbi:four helix bundle protein [Pontiellaceae bacterium B12219]|nr:four helix bundle protein [Pontiellaceae bacterium B12219]